MDTTTAKILAMVSLGVGSLFFGNLPTFLPRRYRDQYPLLISFLLCFGAGVLLSTSIVHILPEVREELNSNYAEIIFCIGFFIVYLTDELVHRCGHGHSHSHELPAIVTTRNYGTERQPLIDGQPINEEESRPIMIPQHPVASVFGLLCALCVHSFLEGLAIGVEKTTEKVILLIVAVSCHKFVVAFCLGVELCANSEQNSWSHIIKILIFSFGSVGGIAIGVALDDIDVTWKETAMPVLQGLAGGTLLYITVCEVLPREKAKWHNNRVARNSGIIQLAAVILGFIVMTLLNLYLSD